MKKSSTRALVFALTCVICGRKIAVAEAKEHCGMCKNCRGKDE